MAVYYKAHSRIINNGAVDDAAASSLTHKQRKTNNNNGHHTHHTHHNGTQHHHRKQLLTGWEWVLLQNERMATPPRRGKQRKKAQGTSNDIPWAVGKCFFSSHFIILLLTNIFIQVLSMLQPRYRPQAAMTRRRRGRPTTTK